MTHEKDTTYEEDVIAGILGSRVSFTYKEKRRSGGPPRHIIILNGTKDKASERPIVVAGENIEAVALKAKAKIPAPSDVKTTI